MREVERLRGVFGEYYGIVLVFRSRGEELGVGDC